MDESRLEERLLSILASLFGALALLLASIGLCGVLSFSIVRRTREIGIPVLLASIKYIESKLFGLGGADPTAMGMAALLLPSVAWRASRLDPMVSLRQE